MAKWKFDSRLLECKQKIMESNCMAEDGPGMSTINASVRVSNPSWPQKSPSACHSASSKVALSLSIIKPQGFKALSFKASCNASSLKTSTFNASRLQGLDLQDINDIVTRSHSFLAAGRIWHLQRIAHRTGMQPDNSLESGADILCAWIVAQVIPHLLSPSPRMSAMDIVLGLCPKPTMPASINATSRGPIKFRHPEIEHLLLALFQKWLCAVVDLEISTVSWTGADGTWYQNEGSEELLAPEKIMAIGVSLCRQMRFWWYGVFAVVHIPSQFRNLPGSLNGD
ncbi:hypothetical protein B0H19DRAFT_1063554 [Mycena capillaripes]|nr:hypothetical protein B0H19DRAFT_1063554 [Mycena capillaripes]